MTLRLGSALLAGLLVACTGSDTTKPTGDTGDDDGTDTGVKVTDDDTPTDTGPITTPPLCGDGKVEGKEECDGYAFGEVDECSDLEGLVGGSLTCSDECTIDAKACITNVEWMQDLRDAKDGDTLSLPIAKAVVTQLQPARDLLPEGFYLQTGPAGPAIFVAIAPSKLSPAPVAGDVVSFRANDKSTVNGVQQVNEVSDWSVDANGFDVASLAQNLSKDGAVVANLDDLESELVTFTATVLEQPTGGINFEAQIATDGYPTGDKSLLVRGEADLFENGLDLAQDCALTFTGIMGRFADDTRDLALPTIYDVADVTGQDCNPPQVLEAESLSETEVLVTFDRNIDSASLMPTDFMFSNDLLATAAAVEIKDPEQVLVTTETQVGALYLLTVMGVSDTLGDDVDPKANTAYFRGTGTERPEAALPTVIFTQYVEGSSFNKALELTNVGPKASTYALDDCLLEVYTNGDSKISNFYTFPEDLELAGGESFTLCANTIDKAADKVCLGDFGAKNGAINHNGDDSYVLRCGAFVVDSFGQVGTDPGSAWEATYALDGSTISTQDATLRRSCHVTEGDLSIANDFALDLDLEWVPFPLNDFTDLGTDVCP